MALRGRIMFAKPFHEPPLEVIHLVMEGARGMAGDAKHLPRALTDQKEQDNSSTWE